MMETMNSASKLKQNNIAKTSWPNMCKCRALFANNERGERDGKGRSNLGHILPRPSAWLTHSQAFLAGVVSLKI